jgi:hypothetical protein
VRFLGGGTAVGGRQDTLGREAVDLDLLDEDRHLQRRDQGGRQDRDVAMDAELAEQVAHVHRGERDRGVAPRPGAAGRLDQGPVTEVELQPGATEREQALHRLGSRAERRRPGDDGRLERRLAAVQHRAHQALAAVEAPEDRALADPRPGGDRLHGHGLDAVLADQRVGGDQERLPVASGVAALPGRLPQQRQRPRHPRIVEGGVSTVTGIETDHGPFRPV